MLGCFRCQSLDEASLFWQGFLGFWGLLGLVEKVGRESRLYDNRKK